MLLNPFKQLLVLDTNSLSSAYLCIRVDDPCKNQLSQWAKGKVSHLFSLGQRHIILSRKLGV